METTTIRVRKETKNFLDKLALGKNDTYDAIILRLCLKALGIVKGSQKR